MKHDVITGVSRGPGRAMAMGFANDVWVLGGCWKDTAALRSRANGLSQFFEQGAYFAFANGPNCNDWFLLSEQPVRWRWIYRNLNHRSRDSESRSKSKIELS